MQEVRGRVQGIGEMSQGRVIVMAHWVVDRPVSQILSCPIASDRILKGSRTAPPDGLTFAHQEP